VTETATAAKVDEHAFSGQDFRRTLGAFATGVTVVTTRGEDEAYGMTATAFSSVSLDPPLVLVCVIEGTQGAEWIGRNGIFAVNVLGAEQEAISRYFAWSERPRGRDAFAEISHAHAVTGSPIIDGTAAHLDCRLAATHEAGDHLIFVGEVLALGVDPDVPPLVFHHSQYRRVHTDE
jgi:flavin reductase (DIM6/NTAB) family NADH-FMN oxidoreductase RutF